ncbi:hypothetical protein P5F75_17655 [Caldifermentibacillus hisashii]|jgi:hypothetical protein|nr:hypothetical protein [Caldifermentibacillus hisashii]
MMDSLQIIDRYFGDNAFYMRSIVGSPLASRFKAAGLRSLVRFS